MTENISSKQMYTLISEAISESHNFKDMDVSVNIKAFSKKHWEYVKTSPQLSFLDEEIPSAREVREAVDFCELLDEYRRSVDVYAKEPEEIRASSCRDILKGLDKYRPYILEEHQSTFRVLEKNIKRRFPEYQGEILLRELNEEASLVCYLKKEASKTKDKRLREDKKEGCSNSAVDFFKKLKENEDIIRNLPDSDEKLELLSNSITIVDCLSEKKYSRSNKYRMKYKLNRAIANSCARMGDAYLTKKGEAEQELEKFEKAIYNARKHLEMQDSEKGRSARAQRDKDDWIFR
ncbi:MAG: hypothetical protein E7005_06340 [Alphaproteobacteria bacterium]|nr:hypothetical protein [Alphaproteobacteria bacterium]